MVMVVVAMVGMVALKVGRGYGGRDRGRGRVRGYHGVGRGYAVKVSHKNGVVILFCNDYVGGAPSAQGRGRGQWTRPGQRGRGRDLGVRLDGTYPECCVSSG
ncbi:hypothetical protein M0R45_009414 [Rubus argutus]|uniref:Secreted protein n=1 Tax=Rubus argutus TaxID=59490 RepID=A0AAW1Y4T0_RUBAR